MVLKRVSAHESIALVVRQMHLHPKHNQYEHATTRSPQSIQGYPSAPIFTIMVDNTTNAANCGQIVITLYRLGEDLQVHEECVRL